MPPRFGKSQLTSQYFPAWYLGLFPDRRIILASYEADFAASWGRKVRDVLEESGKEVFGVEIRQRSSAANRWEIKDHRGGMNTAGVGGPLTGKGSDLLLIDDPLKNAEEASSKVVRDKIWDWYLSVALTRLEPSGAICLVLTRWADDDLAGRLIKSSKENSGSDQWDCLTLPALAEENDALGRRPGEPLWPERFSKEDLDRIKSTIGSRFWSAMYQQRPQPEGGMIFQRSWFRYFREEGSGSEKYFLLQGANGIKRVDQNKCWRFQTVDPAATESQRSDYFALLTWAETPDKELLLLNIVRERAETTKHLDIVRQAFDKWEPSFVGVEDRTFGLSLIQCLKKEGIPVRPLKADKDKVARSRVAAARYETGMIFHKAGTNQLDVFEDELLAFPDGSHDDMVDCASYAATASAQKREPRIRSL
ncbi:MAG: phage terminase large subunit [Methanomassiliicoccales archaeon]